MQTTLKSQPHSKLETWNTALLQIQVKVLTGFTKLAINELLMIGG